MKGRKKNVILFWFSTGDFERIYLGFSGKTHIQIVELLNFRISREILSSHSQLPRLPRMFHPASRLSTKPATDDVYFFISFHSSPFYFWASLVFSRFFCLLTRKSISLQPSLTVFFKITLRQLLAYIRCLLTAWKWNLSSGHCWTSLARSSNKLPLCIYLKSLSWTSCSLS